MPKWINYQLTDEEVQIVDEAINHAAEPEVRQRAVALKLLHLGHAARVVSEILAVDLVSIYNWRKRREAEGIVGLKNRPRSGRTSNADQAYCELLEKVIEQDAAELGYGFTFWAAGRLLTHMETEAEVRLSPNRFRALLKWCDYVYRQPTRFERLARPESQRGGAGTAGLAEENALLDQTFELLFADETTMSLHPILRKCWMKRGQRKLIPASGQQYWEHLFDAYNWRTDCVSCQFAPRKNSPSFIAFIEHLMTVCYPTQKVILVTDNASYHKSQASLAALSLFEDRLTMIWLLPYNPFLNPIEHFWRHLKGSACANKLFSGLDALADSVRSALCQQNSCDNPDRFIFLKIFQSIA